LVDIKEIEENDFNLNIRRYVDNSPEPEIENVHHHIMGSVPKTEVELYKSQIDKLNFDIFKIFIEKDESSFDFKHDLIDKSQIKEIIDSDESVNDVFYLHHQKLDQWWEEVKEKIESFPNNKSLWAFRIRALNSLKDKFIPLNVLDEFKLTGIFVNWWEDLSYDFKTIITSGWSSLIIDDQKIKEAFFKEDLETLEEIEAKKSEIEGELNELLEEIEDWDEEDQGEKSVSKVKTYLKALIKDLKTNNQDSIKEAEKWEALLKDIEKKEKEQKDINKQIKQINDNLVKAVEEKRNSISEEEAKELILDKIYQTAKQHLEKYLNAEKRELIKIFENLWDKYKVSLKELEADRDLEVKKLEKFLEKLGYVNE